MLSVTGVIRSRRPTFTRLLCCVAFQRLKVAQCGVRRVSTGACKSARLYNSNNWGTTMDTMPQAGSVSTGIRAEFCFRTFLSTFKPTLVVVVAMVVVLVEVVVVLLSCVGGSFGRVRSGPVGADQGQSLGS